MKRILAIIFIFLSLLCPFLAQAQELKVKSMEIKPTDLTARVESRVDLDGRKCALLKIYCADRITKAQGNVVGEVMTDGMEKLVYVSHDTKQVRLLFDNHFPLMITFDDHGFPTVSEQMVYEIKLVEDSTPATPSPAVASTPAPAPVSTPAPPTTDPEVLAQAKKFYEDENGDYEMAMWLFRKIDDDKEAQCYIGHMYYMGAGVSRDYKEAAKWYRKSAEQGFAAAQYNLGLMYFHGQGVAEDVEEAVRWYRKAAAQGHQNARLALKELGY